MATGLRRFRHCFDRCGCDLTLRVDTPSVPISMGGKIGDRFIFALNPVDTRNINEL